MLPTHLITPYPFISHYISVLCPFLLVKIPCVRFWLETCHVLSCYSSISVPMFRLTLVIYTLWESKLATRSRIQFDDFRNSKTLYGLFGDFLVCRWYFHRYWSIAIYSHSKPPCQAMFLRRPSDCPIRPWRRNHRRGNHRHQQPGDVVGAAVVA